MSISRNKINEKINIEISLYGAFRKYNSGNVKFEFSESKTCEQIKLSLGQYLQNLYPEFDVELIHTSVLADENKILDRNSVISHNCNLAVLPPVCGG